MKEIKICLLGSGSVGKSALAVQYVENRFVESYDPTVEDCYEKQIKINGLEAQLKIIDTAGTEQFTSMVELYIENCQGFVLVYDVTKKSSFEGLDAIKSMIWKVKAVKKKPPPMLVVANKIDESDREVLYAQGFNCAKDWGAGFIETSAKTKENVEKCFGEIVDKIAPAKKGGCIIL